MSVGCSLDVIFSVSAHYQLDPIFVAAKVCGIERQQPAFAVCEHRRHDVRVMNLLAADLNAPAQIEQQVSDHGPVFKYLVYFKKPDRILQRLFARDGDGPALGSGNDRQVLSDYLAAYSQGFGTREGSLKGCSSNAVLRRFQNPGIDQYIGVNEHQDL